MNLLVLCLLFSSFAFSQTPTDLPPTPTSNEVEELKKKVQELTEVQNEQAELLKRQIKDQHFDQISRGYIEIKVGRSMLNPKDVEDENDEVFSDIDGSRWGKFDYANVIDLEIGKAVQTDSGRHEIGVGYQHLRSKRLQATYTPSGGGGQVKITETALAHTLFARYAYLFNSQTIKDFYFGPGFTLGYSPTTKLMIEAEQGNEGAQIYGEGTSMLVEAFLKAKREITRYFYVTLIAGYRMQEAENLKLNAAEIVTLKTNTDLDLSGFYGSFGLAASF